jgi:hypothetical protein
MQMLSISKHLVFVLSVLSFGFSGCADEGFEYTLESSLSPAAPLANQAFTLDVTLGRTDGADVGDLTVTLNAMNGDQQLDEVFLVQGDTSNSYRAAELVFATGGDWVLHLALDDGTALQEFEVLLNIPEPQCDDGVLNGKESDLDCGGDLCPSCAMDATCNTLDDCETGACTDGACVLPPGGLIGYGDGTPGSVTLALVTDQKLSKPRDLDFNPKEESELWIANYSDDSLTVVQNVGQPEQSVRNFADYSKHFLEKVTAISFGPSDTFGTCGESRNTYDDLDHHSMDFMGPTLWPADTAIFASESCNGVASPICPDAANVHLDMLHSTPLCMGIAATGGNSFYAFGGLEEAIFWYEFGTPHVHGGTDHSDGDAYRFDNVSVRRAEGVPSNMVFDFNSASLYVADSGNGRVFRMSQDNVEVGEQLPTFMFDGVRHLVEDVTVDVLTPPEEGLLTTPSGLALHGDDLYVADYGTGKIHALAHDGTVIRSLDTGLGEGALGGMTIGPDNRIYFVDMKAPRILRIDP